MKAEPIAKTLEAVFRQISSAQKSHQQVIYEILNSELDKKELRHIQPWDFKDKALTLRVDSPAWMFSLNLKKAKLLKVLQEKAGKDIISEIRLRIGPVK
jgi:Dna[CI] antecedent, DciA